MLVLSGGKCFEKARYQMQKNELIHLHALFAELRQELTHDRAIPSDAFREYRAHGVGPRQIHYGKEAHRQAIEFLVTGIMRVLTDSNAAAPASGASTRLSTHR